MQGTTALAAVGTLMVSDLQLHQMSGFGVGQKPTLKHKQQSWQEICLQHLPY
jgi:hypothetical protein